MLLVVAGKKLVVVVVVAVVDEIGNVELVEVLVVAGNIVGAVIG